MMVMVKDWGVYMEDAQLSKGQLQSCGAKVI